MHESVRERDLDHLLLEELHASDAFRGWLLAQVPSFKPSSHAALQVIRSPRRDVDGRQTDLHIDFLDDDDRRLVARMLIENKVTDGFQEGQPESYRQEVGRLRQRLGHHNAAAILVAPEHYRGLDGSENFDAFVPLDDVRAYFAGRLGDADREGATESKRRMEVKLDLLERLSGKKASSGDVLLAPPVPAKREFSERYKAFIRDRLGARYVLSKSSDRSNARTKIFEDFPLRTAVDFDVRLRHEFGQIDKKGEKYVNLQFPGMLHCLKAVQTEPGLLPPDGSIFACKAETALAIRIKTPAIDPHGDRFDEQVPKLEQCVAAIRRLTEWLERHQDRLATVLRAPG